jgi:hypothetical protein
MPVRPLPSTARTAKTHVMRVGSAPLVCFALALTVVGCDTRIVEALDARVTVAVPLPRLTVPDGAPALTADLEVPGLVASPLEVRDGAARGSFSLNVGDSTRTLTGVLRVRGQLTAADDIATLAVADVAFDAAPGVEVNVDDATFTFAPTPERPWLDLNRNGKENRADYEAGCDPAVPIDFIRREPRRRGRRVLQRRPGQLRICRSDEPNPHRQL